MIISPKVQHDQGNTTQWLALNSSTKSRTGNVMFRESVPLSHVRHRSGRWCLLPKHTAVGPESSSVCALHPNQSTGLCWIDSQAALFRLAEKECRDFPSLATAAEEQEGGGDEHRPNKKFPSLSAGFPVRSHVHSMVQPSPRNVREGGWPCSIMR